MKTRVAIIVAILATAFLFTSCDMILEELYPDFKEGGTDKGGLSVEVAIDSSITNYFYLGKSFSNNQIPLRVAFIKYSRIYDAASDNYKYKPADNWDVLKAYYSDFMGTTKKKFPFAVQNTGVYKVIVWLDVDDDSRNSEDKNEPGTIVYFYDNKTSRDNFFLDLRYHTPSDPTIEMASSFNANNRINWYQFFADPDNIVENNQTPAKPTIQGPTSWPSGVGATFLSTGEDDSDGWIVDREWVVVQNGMSESFYGMEALYKVFNNMSSTNQMPVDVKLRVQDNGGAWSQWAVITLFIQPQGYANQAPTAFIWQGPSYTVTSGMGFTLSSGSQDLDGDVTQWAWTVRDQFGTIIATSTVPNLWQILYNSTGWDISYTVSLKVADNQGAWSGEYMTTVIVKPEGTMVNNPPVAAFGIWPGKDVLEGTKIDFWSTSTDNETSIADYAWFVDGVRQPAFDGSSSFEWTAVSAGSYSIQLHVWDYTLDYSNLQNETWTSAVINVMGIPTISMGSPVIETIGGGGTQVFQATMPGVFNQRVKLVPSYGDPDLKVYTDSSRSYQIGFSYGLEGEVDIVDVTGYSSFFIEVFGATASNYTLYIEEY